MSNSILGFSPWRRRASSLSSHRDQAHGDGEDGGEHHQDSSLPIPSSRLLSSSVGSPKGAREPIRSYIHASVRDQLAPVDSEQNARTVREDTAELASYLLSDGSAQRRASFLQRQRGSVQDLFSPDRDGHVERPDDDACTTQTIQEVSEPASPESESEEPAEEGGPSVLANLLKRSPPQSVAADSPLPSETHLPIPKAPSPQPEAPLWTDTEPTATEETPLLGESAQVLYDHAVDEEGQKKPPTRRWLSGLSERGQKIHGHVANAVAVAANPRRWDHRAIWRNLIVEPVSCLPAVAVGLLLNILDALSYGMILFPLGKPIFAHLGSAGISIYYVSTIVSQLIFSTGSIFRGAVGSELIEVVPFFHNMAQKITDIVGEDDPDAVIATTIVAYATSSMMTGLVFYLMGKFKFGYMVGFIPRHILIGCIGGVGWFLIATGFEVSARLDGSLEYDLDTLKKLMQADTVLLWIFPLVLAIVLFYGQSKVRSKYFLPLYILAIPLVFYIFVAAIDVLNADTLRDHGWIFQGPPPDEPWWYFYTLYQFKLVRWDAVVEVIPAMLALTFFGILHVPINVPALALNCGEDNADLDKELKLHGYSNFLSGCFGSIQNYLVYANTVFFIRSGGDRRLAGYILAALTFGVMLIGPSLIGFIPVMMVGTLIFDLGFELLLEAVWLPRKKLKVAEYLTVIAIVLVMGIYDFVVGIGVGILLAFVSLIIQTSRVSAIRGTYDGDIVTSTVRRNPSQHHYLHQAGQQIYIIKLNGYLFFGTIVSVEEKIRAILDDNVFAKKPIKFLILDLWHVSGLDYSAGEAFNTISRLLDNKGVLLVLSGVDADSQLGRNLRAVGLGSDKIEVTMLPNLNSALESCENELLKTLYARQEELNGAKRNATASLDVPTATTTSALSSFDPPFNSPRQNHLAEAAREALTNVEVQRPSRWQSFKEPLRLMLQVFQGLSDKNEDFWFQAASYFKRKEYAAGKVLFQRGEPAHGFYLVERGILRAEYDLPQGWLCESIVAGTTCGELPFFSETERTATAQVDRDCVVWQMDRESWEKLQKDHPDVARELLRISLKLTSERMSAITSYILAMAG
ncbi:sulfate transporter family protein [Purpureocillium lilacinum]|uniref:Sulfate transporter family protein n=1 Tax=Purpureocillium lilacinum TaxID=33203 RepID=A0A179HPZ1_PURLI|nr:sulfate transporter family protein [Purpureocillium lilacinum]OAQ91922.1 sulfate transporter family protein [Purpureocillium lilacinum]